jgi:hypothetical protein
MKKIFTLIAMAVMAMGVNAQTYNLGGLAVADFTLGDGFVAGSDWTDADGGYGEVGKGYATISYTKQDKTNWSDLVLTGKPIVFQYKNSSTKDQFYRLLGNFFYANGKPSRIKVTGLTAGQVVTFKAAGKNDTGCVFAAVDNCTADANNPTAAVGKQTNVENFVDFKFVVTANGDITIEETSAGYHLASITVSTGEGGEQGGGEQGGGEQSTAAINYPTSQDGITLNAAADAAQVAFATVKIHENADAVNCIKFGKSYKYAESDEYYYATLEIEGGFKSGDVITIAGAYNNADEKNAAIAFRSDPASTDPLWLTENFINGRTSASEPVEQTYTLTADAEKLYFGRSGNTGTCVTLLKVARGGATGISEKLNVKITDGAVYNLAGQKVGNDFKGIVIKNGKKMLQK